MRISRIHRPAALVAGLALGLACSDSTGVNDTGSLTITLQQVEDAAAPAASGWYASVADVAESLDPSQVASLTVTVTRLEFLVGTTGDALPDSSWQELALPTPAAIDLMNLPLESESPLVLVAGSVPVGSYRHVRLFVSEALIEFAEQVVIGATFTFEPDTPYAVTIPSVEATGITTDITFTVAADAEGNGTEVQLLFDPAATLANVTANGAEAVMLTPIINAAIRTQTGG